MYDVIVIGTRVAGASTAMLLARRGLEVLAVDRAEFPSHTLSTHQVQVPGVARLQRWGLLDGVVAAGTPATRDVRFDPGPVVLEGRMPRLDAVDALYSPRRTLLDKLLVDAARDAGADGRHSAVAKAVRAPAYHVKPALSVAYYTYWANVPMRGGEMYGRDRRQIGAWPTNDGLVMTYVAAPVDEFPRFRADPEGSVLRALDEAGDLGERVRAGERADRMFGSADLQNRFHQPYGPGWALVGDAGLVMDPLTGQGIADAFRDAELLTDALASGLDGGAPLEAALAGYQARRDAAALPMYEMTTDLASFAPLRDEQRLLMSALEGRPEEIDRFLAVLSGVTAPTVYFTPRNLVRLLGVRGMLKAGRARRRMAA